MAQNVHGLGKQRNQPCPGGLEFTANDKNSSTHTPLLTEGRDQAQRLPADEACLHSYALCLCVTPSASVRILLLRGRRGRGVCPEGAAALPGVRPSGVFRGTVMGTGRCSTRGSGPTPIRTPRCRDEAAGKTVAAHCRHAAGLCLPSRRGCVCSGLSHPGPCAPMAHIAVLEPCSRLEVSCLGKSKAAGPWSPLRVPR